MEEEFQAPYYTTFKAKKESIVYTKEKQLLFFPFFLRLN